MKIFTLLNKNKARILGITFWLLLWQLVSLKVGEEILLVSPISATKTLLKLMVEVEFWVIVLNSFLRIILGFFIALIIGIALASLAKYKRWIKELIEPLMLTIQAVPVASFIIVSLIWIDSKNLATFISFLMVCPIIYRNVFNGIENVSKEILEMASVFKVKKTKKIRYIYIQSIAPFLKGACTVSLGLCFKAGIAAEVIGIPKGTIGEKLYEAKVFLDTSNLFAWTIAIVGISVVFQSIFLKILDKILLNLEE